MAAKNTDNDKPKAAKSGRKSVHRVSNVRSAHEVAEESRKNKGYPHDKIRLSTNTIGKIIDVHRMLDRLFHIYFEHYNITSVQIPVLMALLKHEKLMVSQLASILHIGSSNITPLCKRLEKSGLITRTRDTEDQRVVYVCLTDTAKAMMDEISVSIQTLNDRENDIYSIEDKEVESIVHGVDVLYEYISNVLFNVTGSLDS